MKFTIEQCVFIVETFARKKLTENVSISFVVNILTHSISHEVVCIQACEKVVGQRFSVWHKEATEKDCADWW
jgi:hypothetical protein